MQTVTDACELGRVGLGYEITGGRFKYVVKPEKDRATSASTDRAIVSEAFADQDWNFRTGDRVAFSVWMTDQYVSPNHPMC